MFKREYMVLVILVAMILAFPVAGFSAEKADKDAILQELGSFIDKNPEVIRSAIFAMADEYARQNKNSEATALYEKALKVLPNDEEFLSRLGDLYNREENYAKAAETYKKMTEAKPNNIWNFQRLSDVYTRAGDKVKASAVWEDLLKKSSNAEVFMQAASFYSAENDMEKAIAVIKKATELMPDNTGYLQTLEGFYMRAEKFNEAEAVCNKFLAGGKEPWQKEWASSELINIYQRQDKLAELAVKFEKDLSQSAKDISAYTKLSELYQRNNEQDKAIAVYEKAIAAGLDDRDVNNRLLDLCERSGKLDKAEAQLKKIIGMVPQESYLYERLANMLNVAGKKDDAKKVWEQFLAKVSTDAGAFSRYGDRLNEWGDAEGAMAQYRKAQSLDAQNLWYTMRVADILAGKDNLDAAKKELNGIIAKTTDSWMKQEADRKIKDIEVRLSAQKPAAATMPEAAAPKVESQAKPKAPAAAVPAPEKPAKKKKGLFQ